ncbi:MAG: DedA family protein [Bdellovibrionales bacterium]|nr:DedA family protein [Bdellovibrionales bacterium]
MKMKAFAFLAGLTGLKAYAVIFGVLFFCGLGLPIPEDITLIAAGFLSSSGNISFEGAMAVGFFGVLVGDTILYCIGRNFGRRVFTWPGFRRIFTEARILKAETRIRAHGRTICFWARFLPGLRAPIYLTVGVMKVGFFNFFLLDGLAALISVPVWIFLGNFFGNNLDEAFRIAHDIQMVILGIVLVACLYFGRKIYLSHRAETAATATNKSHS